MDLKQLRSFREVAEAGSLSRAADRLRLAQPALSRQVKLLEEELGLPLFLRHGRGMQLTEAGRELLARVGGPMRQLEQAVAEVKALAEEVSGQVALGMMPTVAAVLAGPLARQVAARYPAISLRIVEAYTGYLTEWVQRGTLDASLLYGPAPHRYLRTLPLFVEELVLVGPPDHPLLAGGDALAFAALRGQPLVLPSRTHGLRGVVEAAASRARIALNVAIEADSFAVLKDLVEAGLGLGVLPRAPFVREVGAGRLAVRPLRRPSPRRQVVLAEATDRTASRAGRAVLDLLAEQVALRGAAGDWAVTPRQAP
jgi:DNA-binding transcriptional LysR family regulator